MYLAWRVLAGLNNEIELSFLRVGHTKFSPDWCFGLLKQKFRRTRVGCLDDIVRVVESSSVVNHAQLVGTQDGTVLVPTYNWAEYLPSYFKSNPFKGIKKLHHLRFISSHPGSCFIKEDCNGTEKTIAILSEECEDWTPSPEDLPPVVPPEGLSLTRRQYLHEKIREFCPPECQDLVCPDPGQIAQTVASPTSSPPPSPTPSPAPSPTSSAPQSPIPSPPSSSLPLTPSSQHCNTMNTGQDPDYNPPPTKKRRRPRKGKKK